ncbi:MAG: DUF106 domain-containing protein [Theionarchaea archaeon]|nr:DUF106 domain-containing protein [Theionarchaea archaeon]MBU7001762.1 DUF106 domain-containing protein [Theionarchaea archaeon]MBU7022289.1 DUF106 domain-containing protein [Theionarchaea archaeon]MBU7035523.1 DUF106 domain-containing protein [Theionarchaea archaeon]MBU7041130.1 DUF106 domain-containing protein [Theionarchaea archaeon]
MILGIWDVLGEIASYFYGFLDGGLGFIWDLPGIYAVFIVSILVGVFSVGAQYFLVDQDKLKTIRKEMSDYQSRMLQAQKTGNKKELRKLEARGKKVKEQQAEMTGMTMKPMMITLVPIMVFFGWVRSQPAAASLVIDLPFTLPYFGSTLGWLGWYFLCSFFFSTAFRKVLDMA